MQANNMQQLNFATEGEREQASIRVLALTHGLGFGGAQVSTLEFFKLLKGFVDIRVVVCEGADERFVNGLRSLGLQFRAVPCRLVAGYPDMAVDSVSDLIGWADIVWITDVEYLAAPKIKRVKRIPVVAHLHSHALLCPWWGLLYGMRDVCSGCSLGRIVRCKQLMNEELVRLGILDPFRGYLYKLLDFAKGPLDYARFRMLLRGVVESIDGFIAVSRFVEEVHRRLLGSDKPIETIYNPVTTPLEFLSSNSGNVAEPRDDVILYASGSNPVKGPHLALEALKILVEEGYKVRMVMTGCKGSWVEVYAKRIGVGEYVEFADKMPPEQLYKLMYRARAVIMSSIVPEAFGRIPVEANRLGTPAVVTNRGGLPETIVPFKTGLVTDPHAESLAKALMQVANITESRKHGEIAELSLKHIDPGKNISLFTSFIQNIA